MKVRELIERLREFDPEFEVWAWDPGDELNDGEFYRYESSYIEERNGRVEIG